MAGGVGEDTPARPEGKAGPTDTPNNAGRTSNRKRKQADFYNPGDVKTTEKLVVKEGEGLKLGSIPNVAFQFSKIKGSDELMEELHYVLFKRKGKSTTRKRDILDFSGFVYEGDKEAERAKYAEKLGRLKVEDIHRLLDAVDIVPRPSGTKDAKVSALLDFLEKPKALRDVNLAERAEKVKQKAKKGNEPPKKSRKKASSKGDDAMEADDKDEDGTKRAEDDEEGKEEEPKEAAEEAPPAKKKATPARAKGTAAKKEAQPKKREVADAPAPRKVQKKAKTEEKAEPGDGAAKEAAQEPSDNELATEVKDIVAGVNIQEFSLKDLMARLEEKFGVSLKKRKNFIKDTVAECTQSKEAAPKEEEGEKPEEAAQEAAEAQPSVEEAAAVPAAPDEPAAEPMDEDAPAAKAPEAVPEAAPEAAPAAAPEEAPAAAPEAAPVEEAVPVGEPAPNKATAGGHAADETHEVATEDKPVKDTIADDMAASVAPQGVAETAADKAAAGDATDGIAPAPEAAP